MSRLKAPFVAYFKGAGVITFVGDRANQAVFWSLRSYNPETQEYGSPVGSLLYDRTKTDQTFLSTNVYTCPEIDTGVYDVVKVEWTH